MVNNLQITVALLLRITIILILFKSLSFRFISVIEEDNAQQMGTVFVKQIALKVNFIKYAALMSFDTAATLMFILLQA